MSHIRTGLGVFIWKDGKFLMGQRQGSHGSGTWSIFGGHLEFGESWEEGAKREILEETGLQVTNVRFVTATNDVFPKEQKQYTTIWVDCDWLAGEPVNNEPDKLLQFDWFDFKQLPSPLFEPCWQNLRQAKPELFV